jgi:hypothetical protein
MHKQDMWCFQVLPCISCHLQHTCSVLQTAIIDFEPVSVPMLQKQEDRSERQSRTTADVVNFMSHPGTTHP